MDPTVWIIRDVLIAMMLITVGVATKRQWAVMASWILIAVAYGLIKYDIQPFSDSHFWITAAVMFSIGPIVGAAIGVFAARKKTH